MRKIIYLIEQPLDERNFERFGIQKWMDRGWLAEVWDLTPLAHPQVWRSFLESGRGLKKFEGYFPAASNKDVRARYLASGRVDYFIDLTAETNLSYKVKRYLIRHGAVRVVFAAGSIPAVPEIQQTRLAHRLRKVVGKGPVKAVKAIGVALLKKLSAPSIRPGLAIVSGELSARAASQSRAILGVHSFDYDIYLRLAGGGDIPREEYGVFIDQDLCFHPDFLYQNTPFVVTPQQYFPAIREGLTSISRSLNLDMLIAAHPRASYEQKEFDCYPGFKVIKGQTAELIARCAVVICHDSTAIHFAVLFGKPMIFVTTDELAPTFEGRSTAQAAAEFGKVPINLNQDLQDFDWRQHRTVDFKKYREYKNRYIKVDGTPDRPMWDVIIDYVEKSKSLAPLRFRSEGVYAGGRE
jgi:hypothetical protein